MNQDELKRMRKLVLIAMFADDYLMETFVLKGGSAIDLAYALDSRASQDIDLSVENDFSPEEREEIKNRIEQSLKKVFKAEGFTVFDFKFGPKPRTQSNQPHFWGGYSINFKIIENTKEDLLTRDINKARREAKVVNPRNIKKFEIDISKYEYCKKKKPIDIDGYTIYVYTPKLLIFEKLRALCQQMPEYKLHSGERKPRPRDFYDIYIVANNLNITFSRGDLDLLKKVFQAKEVPIEFLAKIGQYKDFYIQDLQSLKDTIPADKLSNFDFDIYFNFVLDLINYLCSDS